jgi:hypothetical protein
MRRPSESFSSLIWRRRREEAAVARKAKIKSDAKVFLATVDGGRTISSYRKDPG